MPMNCYNRYENPKNIPKTCNIYGFLVLIFINCNTTKLALARILALTSPCTSLKKKKEPKGKIVQLTCGTSTHKSPGRTAAWPRTLALASPQRLHSSALLARSGTPQLTAPFAAPGARSGAPLRGS
jgi:hypothetical protein